MEAAEKLSRDLAQTEEPVPRDPPPNDGSGPVFRDIQPVFTRSIGGTTCIMCHSSQLGSRSALMATGWVIAGNAVGSKLIRAVRHQSGAQSMPRGTSSRMSNADIERLEAWIQAGAK